jgi:hypothetical protein
VYTSCDKLADGFLEDFYPDGHIRQRGDFWKGRIKDTLVQYYHNGKISIRIRESKEKVDVEEFDSLGCRRRKAGYVNPDGMYFEGNDTTLYFPNGKLQINKMITAEGYIFIDEYYPNGKLKAIQGKNSRIEYFNSGEKNAEYSWLEDPDYRGYFDIVKKIYDKKQRKLREIKYVFSNFGHWEFDYHLSQSRFIESDVRYKNGKQISLVKDLYMDKAENKLRYRNE